MICSTLDDPNSMLYLELDFYMPTIIECLKQATSTTTAIGPLPHGPGTTRMRVLFMFCCVPSLLFPLVQTEVAAGMQPPVLTPTPDYLPSYLVDPHWQMS
uniref:Uncharacterized protein n=1 Tax=Eutreptiella gymnastica TaxID=73025 RepID=A0A7S4FKZ9_9EUGL